MQQLTKQLKERELLRLGPPAMDRLACEVIENKHIQKLVRVLLAILRRRDGEMLRRQIAELAATVAAKCGTCAGEPQAAPACTLPVSRESALQCVSEAIGSLKGSSRYDAAVLLLLVLHQRGRISRDELPGLAAGLFGDKGRTTETSPPEAAVTEAVLRSFVKPTQLKVALDIRSSYERLVGRMREEKDTAGRERESVESKLASREAQLEARDKKIGELSREIRRLEEVAASLQSDLVSQRTSATYAQQTIRARMLGVMRGELSRWLETAQEACGADPPRTKVVRERLEQTLKKIGAEAEWLQSLDSTSAQQTA